MLLIKKQKAWGGDGFVFSVCEVVSQFSTYMNIYSYIIDFFKNTEILLQNLNVHVNTKLVLNVMKGVSHCSSSCVFKYSLHQEPAMIFCKSS